MTSRYDDYPDETPRQISLMDIVFLGFNSRVVALHRETGDVLWKWKSPKGRGSYVAVMLDGDRVIASVQGYTYCLDPFTGAMLWQNPLKGTGYGIPSIVSLRGNSGTAGAAAIIAQQQQAAAASAAGGAGR